MRTALVLIDLINDLIHPDGAMPTCAAEVQRRGVLGAANQALEHARDRGWPTVLVKVAFRAGYPELRAHAPLLGRARQLGALRMGQWGTDFHADLAVEPGDPVLVKHRLSPFHGTALATLLRAAGIERLLLGGRQHCLGAAGGGPGGPRPGLPGGAGGGRLRRGEPPGASGLHRSAVPPGRRAAGGRPGRARDPS